MKLNDLIPRKNHTSYKNSKGENYTCDWWQWFGKPFHIKHTPCPLFDDLDKLHEDQSEFVELKL